MVMHVIGNVHTGVVAMHSARLGCRLQGCSAVDQTMSPLALLLALGASPHWLGAGMKSETYSCQMAP